MKLQFTNLIFTKCYPISKKTSSLTTSKMKDNFVKQTIYGSSLVLQVQPLHSGLARDVHGQLDVIYGPQCTPLIEKHTPAQSMHYKILDNTVHFFAKGIAQV